jgi:hypothetical protein
MRLRTLLSAAGPSAATRAPAGAALPGGTLLAVTGLSGLAAGIHLTVAPEHFEEWWGYGTFFVLAALAECALAAALALRPRPWVVQAAIWSCVVTMLLYVVSRTSGIPLGPEAGTVEPADLPGLTATAAEGALVLVLCRLLAGRGRAHTVNALGLVGVAIWIAALTGALAPSAQPVADHHGGQEEVAHTGHGGMVVPYIPDSVRNGPRPAGDG